MLKPTSARADLKTCIGSGINSHQPKKSIQFKSYFSQKCRPLESWRRSIKAMLV